VSVLNYADRGYVVADFRMDRLNNAMDVETSSIFGRKLVENSFENINAKLFEAWK
jgi:predicted unusual protein kinase regulating ubiquinone biosynthesis (AarF/ABC1/UbiB family)